MKKFFIDGPYSHGYIIMADNEEEALDKVLGFEETMYDSWASDPDDYWPRENDFEILTEEEFYQKEYEYDDLINYDWTKCHWGSKDFPDRIKIEH